MLVAAGHNASSRHFCWVNYLFRVFEICFALGEGDKKGLPIGSPMVY